MRSTEPFLPLELERVIFEMAFIPDNLARNVNMTLVARRVRQWIRPLIFRIFSQDMTGTFSTFVFPDFERHASYKLEEVGTFAKHLFVGGLHPQDEDPNPEDDILRLLQHCPNVENFACWSDLSFPERTLSPILERSARIRRFSLSLPIPSDDSLHNSRFPQKLWCSPAFGELTHLDLINCPDDWPFEVLNGHTSLTHFSVYSRLGDWTSSMIQRVLAIPSLRVFIVSVRVNPTSVLAEVNIHDSAESWQRKVKDVGDLRIVLLNDIMSTHDDWMRGANGDFDTWSLSECIVTARKRRYFKSNADSLDFICSSFNLGSRLTSEGSAWYAAQCR